MHARGKLCAGAVSMFVGCLMTVAPARGEVRLFADRAQWEAEVRGTVCEEFEAEPLPSFGTAPTPYTTAKGTVLTTISSPPEVDIQYLGPGAGGVNGTGELHFRDFTQGVQFTFPMPPRNAFGFSYDTSDEIWTVEANGEQRVLPTRAIGFIGFVDTVNPILSFDLVGALDRNSQGGISVDDLCRAKKTKNKR